MFIFQNVGIALHTVEDPEKLFHKNAPGDGWDQNLFIAHGLSSYY